MTDDRPDGTDEPRLRRALSLPVLTLYGVGTMIGAGFYALLGEVVGRAGSAAPLAVLAASGIAALCALSFAELASRLPDSGGPASYARAAFGSHALARLVGLAVVFTGVVSAGALAKAVGRFLHALHGLPEPVGVLITVGLLAGFATWGILQSALLAGVITVIETGGLLLVLAVRGDALTRTGEWFAEVSSADGFSAVGLAAGAFLAFYAFIGFEDMVTLAEEVREPERTVPRAIVLATVLVTTIYVAVSLVAVLALPVEQLAASETPVADLVGARSAAAHTALGWVGVLAGLNGALVQIVMASRILYGMRGRRGLFAWLGRVGRRTRTPVRATVAVSVVVLVLALSVPLVPLAGATSAVLLAIFALMQVALLVMKRRDGPLAGGFQVPAVVPVLGVLACLALLARALLL